MDNNFLENNRFQYYGFANDHGTATIMMEEHYLRYPNMFNKHSHHMLELSLAISGNGTYEIGDRKYDLKAGDIFVISNTESHRIVLKEGQHIDNLTIHFETSFLWNFYGQYEDIQFLDIFFNRNANFSNRLDRNNPATKEIADLFLQIKQIFATKPPYYKLHIKILMETVLYRILSSYDYCYSNNTKPLSHNDMYKIDEVMNYIHFHLDDHLTLQELAQIACVSPAYFSSIFKRYNGVSLFEYITQKRVNYAVQLIKTTGKSLTEIASLCGFNSSTSFNKAFRRITGFAPSYYRKNEII